MLQDFRYALKILLKSPGFTFVAMLTLALGIGLNTAMFSLINTMLLTPLNLPETQNLYRVLRVSGQQQVTDHSPVNCYELESGSADFAQIAFFRYWGYTLTGPKRLPDSLNAIRVSKNYFDVLRVKPEFGRSFLPEEDQPGSNHVVILSHDLWMSRFRGDPQVVGQTIQLDGESIQIVGVLAEKAALPGVLGAYLCRPLGLTNEEKTNQTDNAYAMIGRYHPRLTATQTLARFTTLFASLAAAHPKEEGGCTVQITSLQSFSIGDTGVQMTYLLLGLSGFVLLIACANLSNLLLARAVSRSREFAIRAALGASRSQLIRLLVVECMLLASAGGGLGILVSIWMDKWMAERLSSSGNLMEFPLNWRVLSFAFAASVVSGLFFSIAPALLISGVRVNDTLKSGTRGSTGGRVHHRFRQTLIAGQFALALVLLAGAAFFARGVDQLIHREAGWKPQILLSGTVGLPKGPYATPEQSMAFYNKVEQRLNALPGVEGTSISYALPMFGFVGPRKYIVEGRALPAPGQEPQVLINGVNTGYFNTIGTRLLSGRQFNSADRPDSPHVVIINQAMARALFPGQDPIGRQLSPIGDQSHQVLQIVGVAEDVRFLNVGPSTIDFQLYQPITQETWNYANIAVRTSANGESLIEPFRRAVADVDPNIPVQDLMPVATSIARNTDDLKLINQLLMGFAILGLFLATLGIYSVVARIVGERTGEIGIRMALGAQMSHIIRLILRTGMRMAIIGAVVGLIGAAILARFLAIEMPGLATNNSAAIVGATVLLFVFALIACVFPARRAAKVDPMVALRCE